MSQPKHLNTLACQVEGLRWSVGLERLKLYIKAPLLDRSECLECFIHSRVRKMKYPYDIVKILAENATRTEIFTESFRVLYPTVKDEISKLKRELNERYLSLVNKIKDLEWTSLLYISASANIVDYEMKWLLNMAKSENMNLNEEVFFEPEIEQLIRSARRVAILLDNAGEAVIDTVLAIKLASSGKTVVLYARQEPYEVDVTVSEAEAILSNVIELLDEEGIALNVNIASTKSSYPVFASRDESVLETLRGFDAIISKGIANLEAAIDYGFPDTGKVIVALRAKCPPIARLLGVPLGKPAIRLLSGIIESRSRRGVMY